MKIYFEYEGLAKEIYFNNIIIFHGNIDNQINLYDEISKGLLGTSKSFLLNNLPVNKKELNIIEFSGNTIIDDLKLTSKSYNLKILESVFDDEEILAKINDGLNNVELKIREKYQMLKSEYNQLLPSIQFQSMRKLVTDNFSLVDKAEVNVSLQIELQLMVILNYIQQNPDKYFYVLLKHFNHCLDISQMRFILDNYKKLTNASSFVFAKSFELFEYAIDDLNYMVNESSVFKLIVDEEICNSELLTPRENEELLRCINARNRYMKYCNIVNEKK